MNPKAMPARLLAALAAFTLPLAACSELAPQQPAGPPPLEGASMGGPFELVGSDGETVRWSDFDGRYRAIYFGFTNCPDICTTDVQRTAQGLRQFGVWSLIFIRSAQQDSCRVRRDFTGVVFCT